MTIQTINTDLLQNNVSSSPLGFTTPVGPFGNQEYINIGATANDGTGDPLRTAFEKINNNFSNLFYTTTTLFTSYSIGADPGQLILSVPANTFTQGSFQINSSISATGDSQNIIISAQKTLNSANVKYTGYATTFNGNSVSRYSMDISGGNVNLYADPLSNNTILHFISAQITYIGDPVETPVLTTQDNYELETENELLLSIEQS